MAYLAKVQNGVVTQVVVVHDRYSDRLAEAWAAEKLGGSWVRCADDRTIRKNYPGIGYAYDATRDAFIPPQPFPSWVLVESTCQWTAPVPMPTDGRDYDWNEARQRWDRAR